MPPAFVNACQRVSLFGRQRAERFFRQRFGHAENRMQRRAKFMAHGGEKFVFHPRGAGQFRVGLLQFERALFHPLRQRFSLLLDG